MRNELHIDESVALAQATVVDLRRIRPIANGIESQLG